MKNRMNRCLAPCLAAVLAAAACTGGGNGEAGKDTLSLKADDVQGDRRCYLAVFEKDTAFLDLAQASRGSVTGTMVIRYHDKPANTGTLKGEFKGDTLFADYTFTTGEKKEVFRNPLAFLRDGKQLILGVGTIETYLGRSYLSKKDPVSFEKGRFRFDPAACPQE